MHATQCVLMETICIIGLVDKRVRLVNGNLALVLSMERGCGTILFVSAESGGTIHLII